jgi:MYXO-CTERM domain-containing protein
VNGAFTVKLFAMFAVLVIALSTSVSRAENEDKQAAQRLLDEGRALMKDGKHAEACPRLEQAVALYPKGVGGLINLAQCYEQIGKFATAWNTYVAAALLAGAAGRADDEKFARDRMQEVDRRVARLQLLWPKARQRSWEVRLDGKVLTRSDLEYAHAVEPGVHTVTISAPGKRPWSAEVNVEEGPGTAYVTTDAPSGEPPPPSASSAPSAPSALPPPPPPSVPPSARGCGCTTVPATGGHAWMLAAALCAAAMRRRALTLAVLVSCRVAEPEPVVRDRPRSEPKPLTATASVPPPAPHPSTSASAARCIWPTPDTPARPTPPKGPDPRCPADPDQAPKLRRATVRVAGLDATVEVEIAERDEHRQRGLMYRTKLAENAGMLFLFEDERDLAFWMRNTCLPLDMLFIAKDGVIVGIEENVPTLNDDNYRPGECQARYVLEVNAGWSRRHGVKAGHKVIFSGI